MAPGAVKASLSAVLLISSSIFGAQARIVPRGIARRDVAVPTVLPDGWAYKGCYVDTIGPRSLTGSTYASGDGMTADSCINYCKGKKYIYAGTEYSGECYCGNKLTSQHVDDTECNMGCSGDEDQACGGPGRLTVYTSGEAPPAGPFENPGPRGWGSQGCYTDGPERTLADGVPTEGGGAKLTVALCTEACANGDYKYAGVEYGGECYCGNEIRDAGEPAVDGCDMTCNGNLTEYCGGPYRMNLYQAGVGKKLKLGWNDIGCYTDNPGARTLEHAGTIEGGPGAMTRDKCMTSCHDDGYKFAGVEFGGECYCGDELANDGGPAPDGDDGCNVPCNGDNTKTCGGPGRLNMFQYYAGDTTATSSAAPSATPSAPAGWTNAGCYTDDVGARTLQHRLFPQGGMTVELCTGACKAAGYNISGVEYANECYCDTVLNNNGKPATSGCNMRCGGDNTQFCGGPGRLNLYMLDAGDTTPSPTPTPEPTPEPTPDPEPSSEPEPEPTPTPTPTPDPEETPTPTPEPTPTPTPEPTPESTPEPEPESTPEPEASTETPSEGQPTPTESVSDGVTATEVPPEPTEPVPSPSTTEAPTSTEDGGDLELRGTTITASGRGSATNLPAGWLYGGCFRDNTGNGRNMAGSEKDDGAMTIEMCVAYCSGLGYTLAGIEYSTQCFCDNQMRNSAPLATPDSVCNMNCGGAPAEKCGGPNLISVYSKGNVKVIDKPGPQLTGLPGSWKYVGCLLDNTPNGQGQQVRSLPYQKINQGTNNAATCLKACSDYGYEAGGMEYGIECYCGDSFNIPAAATIVPETECNTPCPGSPEYICGAGNRISYYKWTSTTPLNKWSYPTGINAGRYQFLIGGVVIPLITSVNVNGKVTFLEKFGTGPPNTTGVYEFDPAFDNDFSKAWRPLHVSTDIFCSASVILPDKAGRQLNVGGWSGVSTEGVRIYWPDGRPGTPGTRDFQEDPELLQLQAGRWYPTAMVMANGSVLITGGERGSNDIAVPSMEILPKVGGTVYQEWLQRTDPYNLYPFMAVLPSGGILAAYYNEARVLDERTFATTKMLPAIPGAVNNAKAGRTYPLEGTMMILPQYASNWNNVGVLICGGSTPFEGAALDNCVSIYPDSANPTWLIERMPSRRVMSCMTALPDGTYLILNGALKGEAGFGLAENPNLNAVLYDPSKPANQRMSVMANTTIARMYHSEAVLMPDGRVLVSGSDPQDGKNPQEYRVEVFLPPYLLAGRPKPAFTIANKDWAYGGQYTFTLTAGSAANLRVSLLGAESSTHGATMGQRTLFPAVSCTGNTCTVTAPPNAHVSPPGWFQMFVLDGPTPSVSTFVRIGGDPARLGNWPQVEGFDTPGI